MASVLLAIDGQLAPARQIHTGEITAGPLNQLRVRGQVLAVELKGSLQTVLLDSEWVAPPARPSDLHDPPLGRFGGRDRP